MEGMQFSLPQLIGMEFYSQCGIKQQLNSVDSRFSPALAVSAQICLPILFENSDRYYIHIKEHRALLLSTLITHRPIHSKQDSQAHSNICIPSISLQNNELAFGLQLLLVNSVSCCSLLAHPTFSAILCRQL